MPFLEHVVRGRPVPRERLLEVAEHYHHFGGRSPLNEHNRQLRQALEELLRAEGPALPVYWGNRHWHPFLGETIAKMAEDGVQRAIAFVTSAYSSYSGCRQYREEIEAARLEVGADAPVIDKLRVFYNHPTFIEVMAERTQQALDRVPSELRASTRIAFTAHSIPVAMADNCQYVAQLEEACRLVAERIPWERWQLVYQSRSGPPSQPWLEPDILEHIEALHRIGTQSVVVVPIGFLAEHMEVIWDLDNEAQQLCDKLGMSFVRAQTAGLHPAFIGMIRELILERVEGSMRRSLGVLGSSHDVCPETCCLYTPQGGRPEGLAVRREKP